MGRASQRHGPGKGILPFVTSPFRRGIHRLGAHRPLDKGMPNFDFTDSEMKVLIGYLRGLVSGATSAARDRRAAAAAAGLPSRTRHHWKTAGCAARSTRHTNQFDQFSATLLNRRRQVHLLTRSGDTYAERPIEQNSTAQLRWRLQR